jgi:HSP20 family protein
MALPVRRRRSLPRMLRRDPEPFTRLRHDPFREFDELWERMGRLFEHTFEGRRASMPWVPTVEVTEQDDHYLLRAELPGIRRKDIQVEVDEHGLSIVGETASDEHERGHILRRRVGKFSYQTALPRDVNPDKAEASLHDGVLTIRLPRTQRSGRRLKVAES